MNFIGFLRGGGLAVIGILAILATGCTSTRYVPVETVRTEFRDRDAVREVADTVRDLRVVVIKGDTVVDVREKERIRRIEVHDTCVVERVDSVAVPYPVERRLGWWEQTKVDWGGWAMGVVAAGVVWAFLRRRRRRREEL